MISYEFDYTRPDTVEAALDLLDDDSKILAGGHSLIPALKLRLSAPGKLIDIARIPSLKGIKMDGNELVIGAAATHSDILESDLIKQHLPMFAEGAALIGDPMIRHKGTLGGSLAHADPSADWPAMVLAAEGTVVVQSKTGTRSISSDDFFTGFYSTALESGEIITEIRFPIPAEGTKMTYQKFVQPASRFAIVGCAALRHPDGTARVAFTGVADAPFRDTAVENAVGDWSEEALEAAVALTAQGMEFNVDHYASETYRHHLARVYCRKALKALLY
ncbi:FAD binding domain-containing protein [Arundinibacter roseus]|uniref:Xanthine dehydrogenase family protein subunit M n=1 Tax=Arundinibacter roseus TaxID=2070510 RepID=A0A4R4KDF7_9BACT|nr:xanthine dehydrogenase family protein subunit M [Arundinibacter roseus]TDB65868.1 xanthine dehydrogenase family protein subunit M [Arundinibacter roseus]